MAKNFDKHLETAPERGNLLKPLGNKFWAMMLAGLVSIIAYCLQFSLLQGFSVAGVGIIVAAAAFMSGGLLGLLFGVPRTLEGERNKIIDPRNRQPNQPESLPQQVTYHGNSNLELISDWLTSFLVGAALTQLPNIRNELSLLTDNLKPGLGNLETSSSFALALIVYFSICGFLTGYLYSRLYLLSLFREAEQENLSNRLDQLEENNRQIQQDRTDQEKNDANALSLIDRQLNPNLPEIPPDELDRAVQAASLPIRVQIFQKAQKVRTENWKALETKPMMERTIPIFQALIKAEQGKFHRTHGELGFALKDQRSPDWHHAELELTKAIELRGDWREHKHRTFYEFNRAICLIQQGLNGEADQKAIRNDLAIAAQSKTFNENHLRDPVNEPLLIWMSTHNYKYEDLLSKTPPQV